MYVVFTNKFKIMSFLSSGKDITSVICQIGFIEYHVTVATTMWVVGQIADHYNAGQNLRKRLQQNKDDQTKALISNGTNISFDSALSSHIFFLS